MTILCWWYRTRLTAYASDALPERVAARIEAHVESCSACQAELEAARRWTVTLRTAAPPSATPNPYLWERLEAAIEAEAPLPQPSLVRRLAPVGALAFSAVALAAVFVRMPTAPPQSASVVKTTAPQVRVAQETKPTALQAALRVEKLEKPTPGRNPFVRVAKAEAPRPSRRSRPRKHVKVLPLVASEQAALLVEVGTERVVEVAHTEELNRMVTETEKDDVADKARRTEVTPADATVIAQNTRSLFQ